MYIIETERGPYYTGITTDIDRRFKEHLGEVKGGAKYFRGHRPGRIVFREEHANRSSASKREAQIKSLSRKQKEDLIRLEIQ